MEIRCDDAGIINYYLFIIYLFYLFVEVLFLNERSLFAFSTPLTCLDHIPFELFFFGASRYGYTVKNQSSSISRIRDIDHDKSRS